MHKTVLGENRFPNNKFSPLNDILPLLFPSQWLIGGYPSSFTEKYYGFKIVSSIFEFTFTFNMSTRNTSNT